MLEYDPAVNLRHYPMPMAKYGLNPFGEPLYRIVCASTRRNLCGGPWADGSQYRLVKTYPEISFPWILERWHSALEFSGMSREQWDRTMLENSGPYPSRGDYNLAWVFDLGVGEENLDNIIEACERGRSHSATELHQQHEATYRQEEKATQDACYQQIRESYSAFGTRPMAGYGGGRGTKTARPMLSANELGLPIPNRQRPASAPIRNRRTQDVRDIKSRNTILSGAI